MADDTNGLDHDMALEKACETFGISELFPEQRKAILPLVSRKDLGHHSIYRRRPGSSYGQKRPPLTNLLQNILERYPDGGQILKELIQNADDAGAISVSFLLDCRSQPYGKSSLFNKELDKFQGPALYAHNNAVFQMEDWEGLESLMLSKKKDDPLKVGRFGIGFNSIYHVTDLPSIVSGDRLVFLDPHEKYFGHNETGRQFDLKDPLDRDFPDQFAPYEDVLDCKISTGFYNGTLFRFPLRTQPSELSQKLYSAEKVRNLFDSLKEEASLILLFLKNVEEINLYETDESTKERLSFSVRLKDSCRADVRQERRQFLSKVPAWESGKVQEIEVNFEMTVETYDAGSETIDNSWLIHNRIGTKNGSLRQLAASLHLLPWIGFAAPLCTAGYHSIGSNGGRIFCFLPLPPDADAKSGFPVHIHGYFGLTDNRRGLKWPGPECQNNDMAEWNVLLLKKTGSKAYASLLEKLSQKQITEPGLSAYNNVYRSWPNTANVQKKWKMIIEPMMKELATKNVLYTPSQGGRWIALKDGFIDRLKPSEVKNTVFKVLTLANEPVISLPPHVLGLVDMFMKSHVKTRDVTQRYVRSLLKKKLKGSWVMLAVDRSEKLHLLEYIILDEDFSDLDGIPLLPLASGNFTDFRSCHFSCNDLEGVVYVASKEIPKQLLPNMEAQFLDESIKSDVFCSLSRAACDPSHANTSPIQLVKLVSWLVISLLRKVLPADWLGTTDPVIWNPSDGNHPSESWLKEVWMWLHSYNLSCVKGLPLIPCYYKGKKSLAKLNTSSKVIRQYDNTNTELPESVVEVLKKAGGIVLSTVHPYMEHSCLKEYVASPKPKGVVDIMMTLGSDKTIAGVLASSVQEKRVLREFLTGIRGGLKPNKIHILCLLPIFEAVDGKSFIAAQKGTQSLPAAPGGFLKQLAIPLPNSSNIISTDGDSSQQLLRILGIEIPNFSTFLIQQVFPSLSVGFYSNTQISQLMCWVLRRIHLFKNESHLFPSHLQKLKFVTLNSGMLAKPRDVFDPRQPINKRLLEGEQDKFPVGSFESDDILAVLVELGLKKTPTVLNIVQLVNNLSNFDGAILTRKSIALFEFINSNPAILKEKVTEWATLESVLSGYSWVPSLQERPRSYPSSMPWNYARLCLCKPSEVTALSNADVVGAVMPVLRSDADDKVNIAFGWSNTPPITKILHQLKVACALDTHSLRGVELDSFQRMLNCIYIGLSEANQQHCRQLTQSSFPPWIWQGHGFASPQQVALEGGFRFNLEPYLYKVPDRYLEPKLCRLFLNCGVKRSFKDSDLLYVLEAIKEKHKEGMHFEVAQHDLRLALDILNWVVREGRPLSDELCSQVLVPVMTKDRSLHLVPCNECTFCDAAWLRGNLVELDVSTNSSDFKLIHTSISIETATLLGVPPLSKLLVSPESLGFEQAGPYEPITTRLKNILAEYKEGAGVFKELIQNADDAGATEVKFLVDWRQHPKQKVFSDGMKECQGAALLAYNNAKFSKSDFENINKLAGATKKEDLDKIGRFGLGFNSVYHFTDVPSFLSSNYAVFFDPHTSHIRCLLSNPLRPGIKVDLSKQQALLHYPDQFQPYDGVFGCDTSGATAFNFNGTLFRFPFRRSPSEICNKQYYREDVEMLFQSFESCASTLLLNSQNVQHVSLWILDEKAKDPSSMTLRLQVNKATVKEIKENGSCSGSSFLCTCAAWSRKVSLEDHCKSLRDLPKNAQIISITCETNDTGKESKSSKTEYWLLSDRLGDEQSLEMALSNEGKGQGLLSCSGIAARLDSTTKANSWTPKKINGEIFCFLPLSVSTGLPVHVNGYFAVTSNRRGIWEQGTIEYGRFLPIEVRWNNVLIHDGVSKAYIQLLEIAADMKQTGVFQGYEFSSLWPNPNTLHSQVWKQLIRGLYKLIATSSTPLLESGSKWILASDGFYPDKDLQEIPCSLQILQELGYQMVDLPPFARKGFKMAGCKDIIDTRTVSKVNFLRGVFFPNIRRIKSTMRDKVVVYVIDECQRKCHQKAFYETLLKNNCCIPCSPTATTLSYPKDLIHPDSLAAALFLTVDNRFPMGECYRQPSRLLMLQHLGMARDLTWEGVCERANTVESLSSHSYQTAVKRVFCLMKYLNDAVDRLPAADINTKCKLSLVKIFPMMKKPSYYVLPWKGDEYPSSTLLSSSELYEQKYLMVLGSSKPVFDESSETGCGNISFKVRQVFQIANKRPLADDILKQLQLGETVLKVDKSSTSIQCVSDVCDNAYKCLQTCLETDEIVVVERRLSQLPWILIGNTFLMSKQVAFNWNGIGHPYLYSVPGSLALKYRDLLKTAGVKDSFSIVDFLNALHEMKETKGEEKLTTAQLKASICFLSELAQQLSVTSHYTGSIPMPNHHGVLRPSNELVINDAPWVNVSNAVEYVHDNVPIVLAHHFGAKDIRSHNLQGLSRPIGQEFGQKEPLTDRLAGILKSYPLDAGILKELVQNADDAEATEIHFVYDTRRHASNRVFCDSWKELQGPALCIYNNSTFSEKDLEGIQRLGIGSKTDSPEKTGQYGIGFNAVYHLTDCPSFITNGETMCILDPHARYAPNVTLQNPGRIIEPLDASLVENYSDVFPGYLGEYFCLEGSTMFRLPLRNRKMARESRISSVNATEEMDVLLTRFIDEARDTLLFLNHLRKISISKLEGDKLVSLYEVSASLTMEDERERQRLASHVKNSKQLETCEIENLGITYHMTLRDIRTEQRWIVHQAIGSPMRSKNGSVPNGKVYGLLPRGGVAALCNEARLSPYTGQSKSYKAFCFLPLPLTSTGLPVHVNAHFALDPARRHLWQDEKNSSFLSEWNLYLKTCVIPEAYVALLLKARNHIPSLYPSSSQEENPHFASQLDARTGIEWFQGLFPSPKKVDSSWKELAVAVLQVILSTNAKVLPMVNKGLVSSRARQEHNIGYSHPHQCIWLAPSESFFSNLSDSSEIEVQLSKLLRDVGFKLLSLSNDIFHDFKDAGSSTREISPDHVMMFLKTHQPLISRVPCPVQETGVGSLHGVHLLLYYCVPSPSFTQSIDGVPLLLTKDGRLRLFKRGSDVFMTLFSDLVSSPQHHGMFTHNTVVQALVSSRQDLLQQGFVKPFTVAALGRFLPVIFPGYPTWHSTEKIIPWKPERQGTRFVNWLKHLWQFVHDQFGTSPPNNALEPLKCWPVIPTKLGYLAPVSLAKTILDLTPSSHWSVNQSNITTALRKLGCSEVDMDFISSQGQFDLSSILKPYLAYPNSPQDVIVVLEHLMANEDIAGRLSKNEMIVLLQFFQEDPETLRNNNLSSSVLRRLPFYKAIHGKYVSLNGVSRVHTLPNGIPRDELYLWMEGTGSVFLEPCHKLELLYKEIGVQCWSHVDCYIEAIFRVFHKMKASTRMMHLSYIWSSLLPRVVEPEDARLRSALRNLPFITNGSGALCTASNFYDQRNPVFAIMLPKERHVPHPFNGGFWLDFLAEIGLEVTCDKQQFLMFAQEVEIEARSRNNSDVLVNKSEVLSKYLLGTTDLHEVAFLQRISNVKFLASWKARPVLSRLVEQFTCSTPILNPAFTHFKNSVPFQYEELVWSSAALLPRWAMPQKESTVFKNLEILEKPTLEQVAVHVKKIASKFSRRTDTETQPVRRSTLQQVMVGIYSFLKGECQCQNSKSKDFCCQPCCQIINLLQDIPFILVEDGQVFVTCKQLAFKVERELPPYLYQVSREYGTFELIFKRLGALEKASPCQYAWVLEVIFLSSKGNVLHAEEVRKVKNAVRGLFETLETLNKEVENDDSASTGREDLCQRKCLYLPSHNKQMKPSNVLVHMYDCPEMKQRVSLEGYDFLIDLPSCGFSNPEQLLSYLPDHLQVRSLKTMVLEKLHPDCVGNKCSLYTEGNCQETNRLTRIIHSKEFSDGIIRILKAHYHSATVPLEVRQKVESLTSIFRVCCLESLQTFLVSVEQDQPVANSRDSLSCFVCSADGGRCIYIQHGAMNDHINIKVCLEINKYLNGAFEKESLLFLQAIIQCHGPQHISACLDANSVRRDFASQVLEPEIGSEIPSFFHYLLVQYDNFLFRPNEIVGYEKEAGDQDEDEPKYVYAKILHKTTLATDLEGETQPNQWYSAGARDLLSRYLIDIGTGTPVEVDVLELYKLKRSEDADEGMISNGMALVLFDGNQEYSSTPSATATTNPMPTTLDEAIEEVRRALADIFQLPEDKRRKAIKRLYFRWHPDKNPTIQELSTQVVQFIQNEVERLERGDSPNSTKQGSPRHAWAGSWGSWNRHARRQRNTYDNYQRSNPGFTGPRWRGSQGSSSFNFQWEAHDTPYQAPDARMSRIWLKQSREDLKCAIHLLNARMNPFYWSVCFHCHQVVEKALKAALFSICGVSEEQLKSHDLLKLALEFSSLHGSPSVTDHAGKLCNYYLGTRYPNRHTPACAPSDVYTLNQAEEATRTAQEVIRLLEEFIGVLHR